MLQLASKNLSRSASDRLAQLQGKVDSEAAFDQKKKKAKSLWDDKTSSNIGATTFQEVHDTLGTMCVSVKICNYCEQNEANDIEHIYPKSLFPGQTFAWLNYLLACKQCNTAYKLDKFAVLDKHDDLCPVPGGTEPSTQRGAFINPRTENPADYLILNLGSFKFDPMPGLGKADNHKAVKTLEVLQLNERDTLVEAREAAAKYFYQRMEMLSRILKANSTQEIDDILTPHDPDLNDSLSLEVLKANITAGFKNDIQKCQHPSVWHAIKVVASKTSEKWARLFHEIPDALNW